MSYLKISSKGIVFAVSTMVVSAHALTDSLTTCTGPTGVDVRTVEVVHETQAALPCTTVYTKQEMTNEIARANLTEGYCEKVGSNVIANLEAANFVCVSAAPVEAVADELVGMGESDELDVLDEIEAE